MAGEGSGEYRCLSMASPYSQAVAPKLDEKEVVLVVKPFDPQRYLSNGSNGEIQEKKKVGIEEELLEWKYGFQSRRRGM